MKATIGEIRCVDDKNRRYRVEEVDEDAWCAVILNEHGTHVDYSCASPRSNLVRVEHRTARLLYFAHGTTKIVEVAKCNRAKVSAGAPWL